MPWKNLKTPSQRRKVGLVWSARAPEGSPADWLAFVDHGPERSLVCLIIVVITVARTMMISEEGPLGDGTGICKSSTLLQYSDQASFCSSSLADDPGQGICRRRAVVDSRRVSLRDTLYYVLWCSTRSVVLTASRKMIHSLMPGSRDMLNKVLTTVLRSWKDSLYAIHQCAFSKCAMTCNCLFWRQQPCEREPALRTRRPSSKKRGPRSDSFDQSRLDSRS